jgi:cytochrome b
MTIYDNNTQVTGRVRVWDLGVRLFHWSLVAMVVAAYFTEDLRDVHKALGYIVVGLIAFRLLWGLIGTRHARFTDFVAGPGRVLGYLRDMVHGRERRYLGHNPAGAAMIIMLFATLFSVGATGYMMGMDAYFGQDWVEEAHEVLVNCLLVLVAGHIGGVIYASWHHRENLVVAMITGDKETDDPTHHV